METTVFADVQDYGNPKLKDKDWFLSVIQLHYNTYFGDSVLGRTQAYELRRAGIGNKRPEKYIELFDPHDKKARWVGIDFERLRTVSVIPVFKKIVASKLEKATGRIQATAIDPVSTNKRESDMLLLKNEKNIDGELGQFSKMLNLKTPLKSNLQSDILNKPSGASSYDLDMSDDDERQLYTDMYYKQKVEVGMELGIKFLNYLNDYPEIKKRCIEDALDLGFVCKREYMDETTGLPKIEYEDPINVILEHSKYPDYRDNRVRLIEKLLTWNDIIIMMGDEIGQEEKEEIFNKGCRTMNHEGNIGDGHWGLYTWNNTPRHIRNVLRFRVFYCEVKSIDGINVFGNKDGVYSEKDWDWQPNEGESKEYDWQEVIYKGYWFNFTDMVYKYGKLYNMKRDDQKPYATDFSSQVYRFAYKSFVEQILPLDDDFYLAFLKWQHALIKAKPKGYAINVQALLNAVQVGMDGFTKPLDLINLFTQTGTTVFSPTDAQGNMNLGNTQPFIELQNGLGTEIEGYKETMDYNLGLIRQVSGIPQGSDASTPDQYLAASNAGLAAQSSLDALGYLYSGFKYFDEKGHRYMGSLLQDMCRYNKKGSFQFIINAIGRENLSVIQSMDEIDMRQFGIEVQEVLGEQEKQFIQQAILQSLQKGEIDLEDAITAYFADNWKIANRLLQIKRKKKMQQNQQMQLQQQQMQGQIDNSLQQFKLVVANTEAQAKVTAAQITGEFSVAVAQLKAQNDANLTALTAAVDAHLKGIEVASAQQQSQQEHQQTMEQNQQQSNLAQAQPQQQ